MNNARAGRSMALGLLLLASLEAAAANTEPTHAGWTLILDNDALVPTGKDQDYTGGFAFTLSGAAVTGWPLSTHGLLDRLLDWSTGSHYNGTLHSVRVGALAFTPDDLAETAVIRDDRPYATLLYWSNGSVRESPDGRSASHASLLVGALGLDAMAEAQRMVHRVAGTTLARGWDHQISDGGEPTALLSLGRQRLLLHWRAFSWTSLEIRDRWDLCLGTETAASYGASLRWGRFNTPWWTQNPEQIGYVTPESPTPYRGMPRQGEIYLSAGGRFKLRPYSAFMQGQAQHSDHRLHFEDIRPLLAEIWGGVTWQFSRAYRTGWVVRAQTSEMRAGVGDRSLVYGGIFISRDL